MSLSSLSIRRPVTVTVFFIAIGLLGFFAFSNLGVNLLPNVSLPHLMIQTTFPNAMPEDVEKQITEPLESAVETVPGIKKVVSAKAEYPNYRFSIVSSHQHLTSSHHCRNVSGIISIIHSPVFQQSNNTGIKWSSKALLYDHIR